MVLDRLTQTVRRGLVVVALGCALLGVVPSIVESAVAPAPEATTGNATYTVRRGDYLYRIARATGTDLSTLLSLNGLSLGSVIHPGQVLRTSGSSGAPGPASSPGWSGGTYTVRRGDYLYRIARATGTDLSTLLSLNGLSLGSVIYPGQVLRTSGSGPATSGASYTVVSGDCWSCIARQVGVSMGALLAANGASTSTMIHPGQVINLPAGAAPIGGSAPSPTPALAPPSSLSADPWLLARLRAVVGAARVDLAESLGRRPLVIVWDSSVPSGTEAVTDLSTTIRIHPRLESRLTRLDNVLAHEFGHVMVILGLTSTLSVPVVCHEKVADEIATRIRGAIVREHKTAECTWEEARVIADQVFALGF